MNIKSYLVVSSIFIWSLTAINILLPQCSTTEAFEWFIYGFQFVLPFLIFIPIQACAYLAKKDKDKKKKIENMGIFLFVCFATTFFSSHYRHNKMLVQYADVSGIVSNKFISNNHATKTITIKGKDYSFLPNKLWELIQKGDNITKNSCNNIVLINESEYQLKN